MPVFFCTVAEGRLTPHQKAQIAEAITTNYNEETGAPRYLVQVIFNDINPGNHYIGGRLGSADQIWVRFRYPDRKDRRRKEQYDLARPEGRCEDFWQRAGVGFGPAERSPLLAHHGVRLHLSGSRRGGRMVRVAAR